MGYKITGTKSVSVCVCVEGGGLMRAVTPPKMAKKEWVSGKKISLKAKFSSDFDDKIDNNKGLLPRLNIFCKDHLSPPPPPPPVHTLCELC